MSVELRLWNVPKNNFIITLNLDLTLKKTHKNTLFVSLFIIFIASLTCFLGLIFIFSVQVCLAMICLSI